MTCWKQSARSLPYLEIDLTGKAITTGYVDGVITTDSHRKDLCIDLDRLASGIPRLFSLTCICGYGGTTW